MKVQIHHQVDKSEKDSDGFYDYYYEYDIYEFSEKDHTYLVRVYNDNPDEANFLSRKVKGSKQKNITEVDFENETFLQSIDYLSKKGVQKFSYLSDEGYKTLKDKN